MYWNSKSKIIAMLEESRLVEQLQSAIKLRIDLKLQFCEVYAAELAPLPNLPFADVLTYLAGFPIQYRGSERRLAIPTISSELFSAMFSLYISD
jgi:hypothetical protein